MEHEYIFIRDKVAYSVYVASSDLANGRYQIFSASLNNIHHSVYDSIWECEKRFDMLVESGIIDSWAVKWHIGMPNVYEVANNG